MIPQIIEIYFSFFLIGLGAYGGGTVVIPLIEREIVLNHGWLTASEFAQVIALSQITPGPIAINAATFAGFHIAGFWGSLMATTGVVTPSIILMSTVIHILKCLGRNCHINRIRQGIKPGVLAMIFLAIISIGKATVYNPATLAIATITFLLLYFLKNRLHPALLIVLAGLAGLLVL